jgi:hypothetical protein
MLGGMPYILVSEQGTCYTAFNGDYTMVYGKIWTELARTNPGTTIGLRFNGVGHEAQLAMELDINKHHSRYHNILTTVISDGTDYTTLNQNLTKDEAVTFNKLKTDEERREFVTIRTYRWSIVLKMALVSTE